MKSIYNLFNAFFLRISLLIFLIILANNVQAQILKEDVIYLKNGSIIRGQIIEQVPDKYVKIEIIGGSIFYFQMNEIEKMTKEEMISELKNLYKGDFKYKDKGLFGAIEFSALIGGSYNYYYYYSPSGAVSIQAAMGYYIKRFFAVGAGVGLDHYVDYHSFTPIFLRVQGEFLEKPVTPFYYIDGGYSIAWAPDHQEMKGGLVFNPGIGVKFNTRSAVAYKISMGYKMQKAREKYWGWGAAEGDQIFHTFNRAVLRFGLSF